MNTNCCSISLTMYLPFIFVEKKESTLSSQICINTGGHHAIRRILQWKKKRKKKDSTRSVRTEERKVQCTSLKIYGHMIIFICSFLTLFFSRKKCNENFALPSIALHRILLLYTHAGVNALTPTQFLRFLFLPSPDKRDA